MSADSSSNRPLTKDCLFCGKPFGPGKWPGSFKRRKYCRLRCHKDYLSAKAKYDPATFWAKVDMRGPDECWEYQGYVTPEGYGWAYTGTMKGQRTHGAHRQAWILTNGPIPAEKLVCHHCDNRRCCNPKHLFVGTTFDNMRDMVRKGRHRFGPNRPGRSSA